MLSSIGCTPADSIRSGVVGRDFPPTPAFAVPVKVLRPPDGTDAEVVAKAEQNGRLANGARLVCLVRWIDEGRVAFATGKDWLPATSCKGAGK